MPESLYLGRIVSIGVTPDRCPVAIYRVASRSFPHRHAVLSPEGGHASILPKPGHESDALDNPYIAYRCAQVVEWCDEDGDATQLAVVSNGSHTDPIAEKIAMGYPVRDAFAHVLLSMDYEKDDYDTPRVVAAVVPSDDPDGAPATGWLGVVRADGLEVREFDLAPGQCLHVSTYEHAVILDGYPAALPELADADAGCRLALEATDGPFAGFANPVTAVCAWASDGGRAPFALAVREKEA